MVNETIGADLDLGGLRVKSLIYKVNLAQCQIHFCCMDLYNFGFSILYGFRPAAKSLQSCPTL